jgi:hypothetical protein
MKMAKVVCNGDATEVSIPQTFADLQGMVAPTQLPPTSSPFVGDGVTDNTQALNNALIATFKAGGGTIVFPQGTFLISGQITIPNDGGSWPDNQGTVPANKPIRITGQGAGVLTNDSRSDGFTAATNGGTILNLTYNAPVAKIITTGQGQLEIDHLMLIDTGNDAAPFILTTNTSLCIHDCSFIGTTVSSVAESVYSVNDAILLGTSAEASNNTTSSIFQGYNTKIQRNFFDRIQRCVFAQNWVNGITISDNVVWINGGNPTGGAFEFVGTAQTTCEGNVIAFNLIELKNYKYGINFPGYYAVRNFLFGNSGYDAGSINRSVVNDASRQNNILGGYSGFIAGPAYATVGVNAFINSNIFMARGDTALGHESGYVTSEDSTGIAGFEYVSQGNNRGWIGAGGLSNVAGGLNAPAILAGNLFMLANTGDVVLISKSAGLKVYTNNGKTPVFEIDANGYMYLPTSFTPASSSSPGQTGQIAWDQNFLYVCVNGSTPLWGRIPLQTTGW